MSTSIASFQIRGRFLTALALRIDADEDSEALYEQLDAQLRRVPQFFDEAPMVLDLSNAPKIADPSRLRVLVANLRRRKLRVFGVQSGGMVSEDALLELGLIAVPSAKDAPLPIDGQRSRQSRAEGHGGKNVVIHAPVRSGQMIVSEHGDITVIGSVASGAELVAGGSIHVYGPLRGRALAGVHGDEDARIFCQSLDAELVAIAGLYKTSETLGDANRKRCTQVFLENDRLRMEVIG
ncbi:septum site-determining protein MinC [Palleronia marisminoris]|uniref:Probable septum site-determining protein MinC n=1 Tax=Palleronia marisminoris TaxID=315423 RepID=A0A1Y5SEB2_9RHOB|nr:septum site-determining protein MinC [Palleronia marisminoris]SFG78687.1 septum site-determining protein MinC [Palleronia marisminoris]SLN38735.1 Septum site-determining protein MinC [Palleronia marisminoris]